MASILYLTDFYYKANGRNYFEEDLFVTSRLKDHFDIVIGHPQQALSFLNWADLIVFRNTGPVMWYKDYFDRFVAAAEEKGIPTFNSFDGKADRKGKDYLLQLAGAGYPVIPTVDRIENLRQLGEYDRYVVKQKDGADSIGMLIMNRHELLQLETSGQLIQPYLDFVYEVSFYYLNNQFQYALYAPAKEQRWNLQPYQATLQDIAFAERFVKWNNMQQGIIRVDACRLNDGSLLLVELEDLNPFLSLAVLPEEKREEFVRRFAATLQDTLNEL